MASGRYPVMASLSRDTFSPRFDHFEFGLQRLLEGLDVLVARRRAGEAPPAPDEGDGNPGGDGCGARRPAGTDAA